MPLHHPHFTNEVPCPQDCADILDWNSHGETMPNHALSRFGQRFGVRLGDEPLLFFYPGHMLSRGTPRGPRGSASITTRAPLRRHIEFRPPPVAIEIRGKVSRISCQIIEKLLLRFQPVTVGFSRRPGCRTSRVAVIGLTLRVPPRHGKSAGSIPSIFVDGSKYLKLKKLQSTSTFSSFLGNLRKLKYYVSLFGFCNWFVDHLEMGKSWNP